MNNADSTKLSDLGPKLFSYAVIADTHVNHGEKETNSVYPVNALHNGRLRHVVRDINSRPNLEFVIHLGDLVHPVPALPDLFSQASACYKDIMAELNYPVHVIPGNHDIGDKPSDWTPAVCVNDEFLDLYREQFGADYSAFNHDGIHFILLNASIINSDLACEQEQKTWLEDYFKAHAGGRFFVNIHYPAFLAERNEASHYDNIDEPGRTWLLDLLEKNKVEALFSAHTHNFWYHRHEGIDFYYALSTACVRQDYSEIVRVPPMDDMEGGRNDQPKHGYYLVHVHENRHVVEVVRTYGELIEPDVEVSTPAQTFDSLHPLQNPRACLGFDMRQDWMDLVQVPPSGGPDEFNRKAARNDYPLMNMWEMGIRRLRIPRIDLQNAYRRDRLRALCDQGHEFVLYTFGIPEPAFLKMLAQNADLISAWEITFPWSELENIASQIAPLRTEMNIPIYLSKLRGKEEHEGDGAKFVHAINHGFVVGETDQIHEVAKLSGVDGVVFRVASDAPVWENVIAAGEICDAAKIAGSLITRMSPINPAEFRKDDLWTANRVGEAMVAAMTQKNIHVIIDTLADIDRGYFRRNGVVDRLYNPRLGFHVIRHLYGALNADPADLTAGKVVMSEKTRSVAIDRGSEKLVLVMPLKAGIDFDLTRDVDTGDWACINLQTGELQSKVPEQLDAPILLTLVG